MTEVLDAAGPVCMLDDLAVGEGRVFVLSGEQIALFRMRDGSVRATAASCPHRGGPIADGQTDAVQVVCPLHQYAFDLTTGACHNGSVPALRTWPVTVDDDGGVRVSLDG